MTLRPLDSLVSLVLLSSVDWLRFRFARGADIEPSRYIVSNLRSPPVRVNAEKCLLYLV